MSCCCNKIFDFCSIPSNGFLKLGILAPVAGVYKLVVDFLGTEHTVEAEFVEAEPLVFPLEDLNEAFVYIGRVYSPTGAQLTKEVNGVQYECFSFETKISYTVKKNTEPA